MTDASILPVDKAADAFLAVNPTLGAVIIFEAAAIVFLVWWVIRLIKDRDVAIDKKDAKIEELNELRIADLQVLLPAVRDLKELAIDLAINARGRPVK